ncbi:MAG: glycosyltransferase family 4 protein [Desulfovibrionaceae bacterium]|nr:glycosyltransferase family 4 protein [Desulfovibrionaceae bacterium]MBF0512480.1 glycosyltransferase family 4 protein [Desulfovibrionaceae bacterium]
MVWSANEPDAHCRGQGGRGFGRNYIKMMAAAACGRIAKPAPAVIACMHLGLSPAARLLAARTGAPYVVFLHGVEAWRPLRGRSRWGLAKAALLMANSRFTLRGFVQANPECASLPSVITALGVGEPGEAPPEGQTPNRGILIVSRMDKADDYKGHRVLIQALGLLVGRFPDVRLTVSGDGDDRAGIEAYAASMPYAGHIEFVGRVPDDRLDRLYAQSAVFAMPSAGEGFGLVFLEAMAHGLPCICGDRDASGEVVADGLTGYCLPPGDPAAVAEGVGRLLADESLRRRFGEAGRSRYLAEFTGEHFKRRIRSALALATGRPSWPESKACAA